MALAFSRQYHVCYENSNSSAVSATAQVRSACLEGSHTVSIHDSKASLLCSGVLSVSDLASPIRVPTRSRYSFVAKWSGLSRISGIVCFEVGTVKQF